MPETPPPASLASHLQQAMQAGLPRLEAQMLLLHALGRAPHERAWLLAHDDQALPPAQAQRFAQLCTARLDGQPMAYLTGRKHFYGLELHVDARVLDPRPDTEILVDWALELLPTDAPARVLDLGTGSGAIALALAQARPQAQLSAVDASADALAVARANAERFGLTLQWQQGNWLQPVAGQRFELIVSNPPYIAESDPHLPALRHEPALALSSGPDGLDALRELAAQAPAQLVSGGWLLLEHGHDQGRAVRDLLLAAGLQQVSTRRDLAGHERCTGGQRPGAQSSVGAR